ncbi:MAG: hypothetical protein MUE68_03785 [Bacteroidetes bacterium]|jgi:hypothetical protein|nr:hypothetical protein [Bacteroidota bacterium]
MRAVRFAALASTFLLAWHATTNAQVSTYVNRVDAPAATQATAASIGVEMLPSVEARRAWLRYRSFGVTEFSEMEMLPAGRSYTATIPATEVLPPYLQYYIAIELSNGTIVTYPETSAELNPLQVTVQQVDPREGEVRILSPEPGETVAAEDFVLAISLYYASPAVAPSRTRVFVDGVDISREAILSDDMILWSPANSSQPMKLGARNVRVELRDTAGNAYFTKSVSFSLSTVEAIAEVESRFHGEGDVRAEYRNEQTANSQTFARLDARATGSYSFLDFGTTLRFDNLEGPDRQPQNRYSAFVDAEYARLEVGDAYPKFPSLMMLGKRVRGIAGALKLGFFNLDVSFGQTDRKINGTFLADTTFADTNGVRNRPDNTLPKGTSYFAYELFNPGTFTREFIGVRPSFGSGENFQLGFTYLKFKDDMSSIRYGIQPKENLVVGTDLALGFDDQRIRWETQVAVGLQNRDISSGNFTAADYDSLAVQGQNVKDLGQIAEQFITVNANLEPLNPAGTGLPGIAMESFLTLSYFNNYVRAQYLRRGTAFKTFGNEFQQSDIQGFVVSDNVRLLSNRLFASVSYEAKSDNLSKSKSSTTDYNNLITALTFNPGAGYPTLQVGYGMGSRLSDQIVFTPDSSRRSNGADDQTNRITFGASYDLNVGFRNFVTLSINLVDRADNTIYRRDQTSTFINASVTSFFTAVPLQTTINLLTSSTNSQNQLFYASGPTVGADSAIAKSDFAYTALGLSAQYRLLDDHLRLVAQVTPTFGDLERTIVRLGGDYSYQAHAFELYFDYFKNTQVSNDRILSFVYRYNF